MVSTVRSLWGTHPSMLDKIAFHIGMANLRELDEGVPDVSMTQVYSHPGPSVLRWPRVSHGISNHGSELWTASIAGKAILRDFDDLDHLREDEVSNMTVSLEYDGCSYSPQKIASNSILAKSKINPASIKYE